MNKVTKAAYITGGLGIIGSVLAAFIGLIKMDDNNDLIVNNSEIDTSDQSQTVIGNNNNVKYNNYTYINNIQTENNESNTNFDITSESKPTDNFNSEEISQFNFGDALRHIFNNEDRIENQNEDPINSSIYSEVNYYYISDKISLIEVDNGFRNINYSRSYQFDEDEKLTFALIFAGEEEHRLYFYNDILIRYIDENSKCYDINHDLDSYQCEFEELALNESYEILGNISKSSEFDTDTPFVAVFYQIKPNQISISGVDLLVTATTSLPAEYVTISSVSSKNNERTFNMHGNANSWSFDANFYIKGTYTITVTAYFSDGQSASDSFIYTY